MSVGMSPQDALSNVPRFPAESGLRTPKVGLELTRQSPLRLGSASRRLAIARSSRLRGLILLPTNKLPELRRGRCPGSANHTRSSQADVDLHLPCIRSTRARDLPRRRPPF